MLERLGLLSMLLLASLFAPARAADVTGTWRVTISTSDGTIIGKASLKRTGDRVTGWVGPLAKTTRFQSMELSVGTS